MYDTRGKIGLIVPHDNTVIEPEIWKIVPEDISVHVTRAMGEGGVKAIADWSEEKRIEHFKDAGLRFKVSAVDAIVNCQVDSGYTYGIGWDKKIAKIIENVTGIPTTTALISVLEAFKERDIKRLAVVAHKPLSDQRKAWFEDNDLKVVNAVGNLGYEDGPSGWQKLESTPVRIWYKLAREADTLDADAIYFYNNCYRTMGIIDYLERDLRKTVISVNAAIAWGGLRKAGIHECIEGCGSLLRRM